MVSQRFCNLVRLGPIQMFVQEIECALTVDGVGSIEELDFSPVAESQFYVASTGLGEFIGYPLIGSHTVVVTALDHKRPRKNEPAQFGIVKGDLALLER